MADRLTYSILLSTKRFKINNTIGDIEYKYSCSIKNKAPFISNPNRVALVIGLQSLDVMTAVWRSKSCARRDAICKPKYAVTVSKKFAVTRASEVLSFAVLT